MAYRKKSRRKSSGSYRPSRKKSYSGKGRSSGRVQTVRIQLVGPQQPVVQTSTGPMMAAAPPRRASF